MTEKMRNKIATVCLFMGTFFLPFGFDVIFYQIMRLTGSYLTTTLIFYCISGLFFTSYLFFSGIFANKLNSLIKNKDGRIK